MYIAGVNQAVDTGDTYFIEISSLSISGAKEAKHKLAQRSLFQRGQIYDAKPIEARIEYARWIVDCPNCHSAEFAFEDKLFLCSACKNSDIGGQIRKVKMPPQRKEIENILGKRKIINRHWFPEQTIKDLEEENTKHGLRIN